MTTSSTPWLRIVAVALFVIAVGWPVLSVTVDQVLARRAASIALPWWPHSAVGRSQRAELLLAGGYSPEILANVTRDAQASYRRSPINPTALRTLAFAAFAQQEPERAARLMHLSERFSRRDLGTQLWLIDDRARAGDLEAVVSHYDHALRTSRYSRQLLFPVLKENSTDPLIQRELSQVLSRRPPWWRDFLHYYLGSASDGRALYQIVHSLGFDPARVEDGAFLQGAILRLTQLQDYENAFRLYAEAKGTEVGRLPLVRVGGFETPSAFYPIDWRFSEDPDLRAEIVAAGLEGRAALRLVGSSGRRGEAARQALALEPGQHALSLRVAGEPGGPPLAARVTIRCLSQGPTLIDRPLTPDQGGALRLGFAVPAGCPYQTLAFEIAASDGPRERTLLVNDVSVTRAGR